MSQDAGSAVEPYLRRLTVGKNAALFNRGAPISTIAGSDTRTVNRSGDPEQSPV